MISRQEWDELTAEQQWEYLQLTEKREASLSEVLALIPECPEHGNTCIPHAMDWLKAIRMPLIISRDARVQ